MADFYIKKGAQRPTFRAQLFDEDGNALDLTGATAKFIAKKLGETTRKIDAAMTISGDPTLGQVEYAWAAADVDTASEYRYEIHVTLPGAVLLVVPSDRYHVLAILETL